MLPGLRPGDVILVRTSRRLPKVGDVVVVRPPGRDGTWVKRVRSRGDASFSVASDNPLEGTDSRHIGSLRAEDLLGRVLLRLPRWKAPAD